MGSRQVTKKTGATGTRSRLLFRVSDREQFPSLDVDKS
jgi:hypothetical protein